MERIKRVLMLVFSNIYTYRVDYIRTFFLLRMFQILLVVPGITLLFSIMLSALDIQSVTEQNLPVLLMNPFVWFMLLVICLIVLVFIFYEMGLLMLMAYHQQRGIPYTMVGLVKRLNQKVFHFLSWQTILLFIYLLLMVPLISTVLPIAIFKNLQIPHFIVDELMTSTQGKLLYFGAITGIFLLGLRFIFTLPYFTMYQCVTVWEAVKMSWGFSRKKIYDTLGMLAFILLVHLTITITLLLVTLLPLLIIERVLPVAALVTAAITLTLIQGIAIVAFTTLQAVFSQILVLVAFQMTHDEPKVKPNASFRETIMRWTTRVAIAVFVVACVVNLVNLARTVYEPQTTIVAHRGFMEKAVENTMGGLIASHEAGAEMVEIDIQQTKDGKFVVFHDATLSRLAGRREAVHSMTQAELMDVTIRAGDHSEKIPSLEAMLEKSEELGMRLLIEVKPHGYETDDMLERVITLLDEYDAIDFHLMQSLDYSIVKEIKELEPRIKVGIVYAVNLGALPHTVADFVSMEQYFSSSRLIEQAHEQDKEFYVWTVNTNSGLYKYYGLKVDGIITNNPDDASIIREKLAEDEYFLERVINKLTIIF